MRLTKLLSALALAAPSIGAPLHLSERAAAVVGSLTIKSSRSSNTYFSVVFPQNPGPMQTLPPGQSWTQQFQTSAAGGISVKLGNDPQSLGSAPLQLEYTVNAEAAQIFYDMSTIDGQGAMPMNWKLEPVKTPDPGNPTCVVVSSKNAYHDPGEKNAATKTCSLGNSMVLTLY